MQGISWAQYVRRIVMIQARKDLAEFDRPFEPGDHGQVVPLFDMPDLTGDDPHGNDNDNSEPLKVDSGGT